MSKILRLTVLTCFFWVVFNCTALVDSSEFYKNQTTAFTFDNPLAITTINQEAYTITVIFPFGTDVSMLVPVITHTGYGISPTLEVSQDFSSPMAYQVIALDKSIQTSNAMYCNTKDVAWRRRNSLMFFLI